jgi:hypothetical protein
MQSQGNMLAQQAMQQQALQSQQVARVSNPQKNNVQNVLNSATANMMPFPSQAAGPYSMPSSPTFNTQYGAGSLAAQLYGLQGLGASAGAGANPYAGLSASAGAASTGFATYGMPSPNGAGSPSLPPGYAAAAAPVYAPNAAGQAVLQQFNTQDQALQHYSNLLAMQQQQQIFQQQQQLLQQLQQTYMAQGDAEGLNNLFFMVSQAQAQGGMAQSTGLLSATSQDGGVPTLSQDVAQRATSPGAGGAQYELTGYGVSPATGVNGSYGVTGYASLSSPNGGQLNTGTMNMSGISGVSTTYASPHAGTLGSGTLGSSAAANGQGVNYKITKEGLPVKNSGNSMGASQSQGMGGVNKSLGESGFQAMANVREHGSGAGYNAGNSGADVHGPASPSGNSIYDRLNAPSKKSSTSHQSERILMNKSINAVLAAKTSEKQEQGDSKDSYTNENNEADISKDAAEEKRRKNPTTSHKRQEVASITGFSVDESHKPTRKTSKESAQAAPPASAVKRSFGTGADPVFGDRFGTGSGRWPSDNDGGRFDRPYGSMGGSKGFGKSDRSSGKGFGKGKHGPGSALMEDFRMKSRKIHLSEIAASEQSLLEFALDQYGSRYIQKELEFATSEERWELFQQVVRTQQKLTADVFGNYVIQKLFEHGSADEVRRLAQALIDSGAILNLCFQLYGCRVVQKALEYVQSDMQRALVGELKTDKIVLSCIEDQNANHVIQKCLERMPHSQVDWIVNAFSGEVRRMATHCYGCRVLQRIIEYCSDAQTARIFDEVHATNMSVFVHDQYGNYVIQYMVEYGRDSDRDQVLDLVCANLTTMSCHKFASNIVEKVLTSVEHDGRKVVAFLESVLGRYKSILPPALQMNQQNATNNDESKAPLLTMMKDKFGNYVVQRLMRMAREGPQKQELFQKLKDHLALLQSLPYGKHIMFALREGGYMSDDEVNEYLSKAPQ